MAHGTTAGARRGADEQRRAGFRAARCRERPVHSHRPTASAPQSANHSCDGGGGEPTMIGITHVRESAGAEASLSVRPE